MNARKLKVGDVLVMRVNRYVPETRKNRAVVRQILDHGMARVSIEYLDPVTRKPLGHWFRFSYEGIERMFSEVQSNG